MPLHCSPKGALSNFGHFFIFRKFVTERKFNSVVVFGHDGGLPIGPAVERFNSTLVTVYQN